MRFPRIFDPMSDQKQAAGGVLADDDADAGDDEYTAELIELCRRQQAAADDRPADFVDALEAVAARQFDAINEAGRDLLAAADAHFRKG